MSDTQDDRVAFENAFQEWAAQDYPKFKPPDVANYFWNAAHTHFQRQAEPVGEVILAGTGCTSSPELAVKWYWPNHAKAKDKLYTAPPVPADMVMVPREPTEEHFKRGIRAFQSGFNGIDNLSDWRVFWQAMITAAPKEGS